MHQPNEKKGIEKKNYDYALQPVIKRLNGHDKRRNEQLTVSANKEQGKR